ncbi:glia maturation factor beta [Aplysia californica]|uniref:Glia maturation factor beta n=1 Tax=Aplysia californica TaxID=6500 RepID=A0ABM1AE74_APLCA|nr:glia maturation factor beta [Aplysia californica]XP_012945986.1 glia maturation factor beta [Aplysia californica]
MSSNVTICETSADVLALVKKFRMRKEKNIAAIVLKIDKPTLTIVLDEEHEDITIEDLQDELPAQQPRYIILSYVQKHDDGRTSFPLMFIYVTPQGCNPEQQMMYAGSKLEAVKNLGLTKVIELRSLEDLTEETVLDKLKLFK